MRLRQVVAQEWSIAHTYLVSARNGHSEYKIFYRNGSVETGAIGSRMRDVVLSASRN
jgi:hypothetical protein